MPPKRAAVAVVDDDDDAFQSEDDTPLPAAPRPAAAADLPAIPAAQPSSAAASPAAASPIPQQQQQQPQAPIPKQATHPSSPPKPRPKKLPDGTIVQPEMDFTTEPFDALLDREDEQLAAQREARRAAAPKVLSGKTLLRLSQPRKAKPAPAPPAHAAAAGEQRLGAIPTWSTAAGGVPTTAGANPGGGAAAAASFTQARPGVVGAGGVADPAAAAALGPPKGVLAALTWNNLSAAERANETHFYICLYALGLQHHLGVDKRTTLCSLCEFVRLPVGGTLLYKGKPVSPFATAATLGLVAGSDHIASMRFVTPVEEDEQLARDDLVALQIVTFSNRIALFHSLVTAQEPVPRHVFFDACDVFEDLTGEYWAYRKVWSPAIPYAPVNLVLQQQQQEVSSSWGDAGVVGSPQARSRVAGNRSVFF